MRYYSTQRPVAPGTFPKPDGNRVLNIYNRDQKGHDNEPFDWWGWIEYEFPLSGRDIRNYELRTADFFVDEFTNKEIGSERNLHGISTRWRKDEI